MIGQPLGCILVLMVGVVAIAIPLGVFWCINLFRQGLFGWGLGTFCLLPVVSIVPFSVLLEFGHRLEIRLFFSRRGLRIQRIRGFKNHYRVYYLQNGKTMSGKWPKDFESWVALESP